MERRTRYRGQPDPEQRTRLHLDRPEHLTGYGAEHWDFVVPRLLKLGALDESGIDLPSMIALCQWWHEYRTLQDQPAGDSSESYKRSIAMASCFKNWSTLADKFGLSPKSREKLSLSASADHVLDQYLN